MPYNVSIENGILRINLSGCISATDIAAVTQEVKNLKKTARQTASPM